MFKHVLVRSPPAYRRREPAFAALPFRPDEFLANGALPIGRAEIPSTSGCLIIGDAW